jgi:glycosyltransferase involved in cell wall biosynthesis
MSGGAEEAPSKVPVSAVVAGHDEADELARCLPTLRFCDEVVVIDLESTDDTVAVAERCGARVVRHDLVPIAEYARVDVVPQLRHDWLLFTDPDEEIPGALAAEVARLLATVDDDVALVWAPIQFYFGRRPLRGTVWGGANRRRFLVRRDGVELSGMVFGGTHLKPGFRAIELPFSDETAIRHHWVSGYRDWIGKHRRYLELQPADRERAGHVTGFRAVGTMPWRSFYDSLVARRGYRDGLTGVALSSLWAWFTTASELALLRRLRRAR